MLDALTTHKTLYFAHRQPKMLDILIISLGSLGCITLNQH